MIHYSFIGYIIAMAIILIICTIAYRFLLENKMVPSVNRRMLLLIYAAMILIPFLVALIPASSLDSTIEIEGIEFAGLAGNGLSQEPVEYSFSIKNIVPWVINLYFCGVFIMFLISIITVCRLFYLMKKSRVIDINGVEVYLHKNKKLSSFSWFNKIFLYTDSLNNSTQDLEILLKHELAHLDKGHWLDLALAQIVMIFQWFNPGAWYIRNELQRIHEYEADNAVLSSGINEKEYQMLLIRNISRNRYSGLTDGLNNCSLKLRIIMMKKKTLKSNWVVRGLALSAFAIGGGLLLHIPAMASVLSGPEKKTPIQNVASTLSVPVVYTVDGVEKSEKEVKQLNVDDISSMEVNKSTQPKQVKIETKNTKPHVNKGELKNYPDAYLATEKPAQYEGGETQLMNDLARTIIYPKEAHDANIQGRVIVRFQVNTNGTTSNYEVVRSVDPSLDEAAIKALENLPNKWIPGEIDGKPVASVFNIPVTFKLTNKPADVIVLDEPSKVEKDSPVEK